MTDHRARAADELSDPEGDPMLNACHAQVHALLAIHDLLAERLPESQARNSMPEGAVWRPEGLTVAEAGRAAQEAAEAVRSAYSAKSDDTVTVERAQLTGLLARDPVTHWHGWPVEQLRAALDGASDD